MYVEDIHHTKKAGTIEASPFFKLTNVLRLNATLWATATDRAAFASRSLRLFARPLVGGTQRMSSLPTFTGDLALLLRTH